MDNVDALFAAVRALRDALHSRLDDNVSDRVFTTLRLRHGQAVVQARRETEVPPLPQTHSRYASTIAALDQATQAINTAVPTNDDAMLAALRNAGAALDRVDLLP